MKIGINCTQDDVELIVAWQSIKIGDSLCTSCHNKIVLSKFIH